MKKIIAFDLDGTLADSKSPLDDKMSVTLNKLLDYFYVCVISGGKFEQFETQLLNGLNVSDEKLSKIHIMPTCGTRYYLFNKNKHKWEKVYSEDFTKSEKEQINTALNNGVDALGLRETKVYGELIEDRGSQITFSALGQDIVEKLGTEGVKIKEDWDPDNKKKGALRDHVSKLLPDFEVRAGGATSIDITRPGIDKAYGMRKLMEKLKVNKRDILFFGDKLDEGGNDFPVKAMGIESIEVSHWQDTVRLLETILYVV